MTEITPATTTELEAAAFRRLVEHLRQRTDVQNIDLMNLAGFCRNCLSNWYQDAAGRTRNGSSATRPRPPRRPWKSSPPPAALRIKAERYPRV
jgi:hypothetical protein